MMSVPTREDTSHIYETLMTRASSYETLMSRTPSYENQTRTAPFAVPASNVPVASYFQNVSPQHPMYYGPPTNQNWSVPTGAPQWQLSAIIPQNKDPSLPFFQTFLKGKPKALGILVIVAAILEIGLGIALIFSSLSTTIISGITFWGPVFYIIAGSLTIAAQTKPNICLIRGSLGLNIISSIFSMTAVILNSVDFIIIQCYRFNYSSSYTNLDGYYLCQQELTRGYAVLSVLLGINLLLFCITISTSVFGCRSLSKEQNVNQVFVIQNDVVFAMNTGVPVAQTTNYAQQPPLAYSVNVVKL
ncbi:membrane-spanning 4-domains subfamily A member 4D-like [Rana temporaria]|uniref:membrane-spanning 4-domains subfamily A member 4D-like n=1 Tax=Rana temporaria TaxID=8407 RepID=UPI001AAC505C|nr:membrane-spanning 4-domains subfamily A member 4D-like [Rana temporaria]XP_040176987.1 membrane-spanning 4-domains subfamily A member 4D-like [Rana temporaria]